MALTIEEELDKVILWQYDNAENLIAIVDMLKDFFNESTVKFWNNWFEDVVDIDTANDFGLSVWGKLLKIPRFMLDNEESGEENEKIPVSTELYRKIIKAKFKLLNSNATFSDYVEFCTTVFGDSVGVVRENVTEPNLKFIENEESPLSGEEELLFEQYYDAVFEFPAGVRDNDEITDRRFCFDGQQNDTSSEYVLYGGFDESVVTDTSEAFSSWKHDEM